jgi:hypothetical protein
VLDELNKGIPDLKVEMDVRRMLIGLVIDWKEERDEECVECGNVWILGTGRKGIEVVASSLKKALIDMVELVSVSSL